MRSGYRQCNGSRLSYSRYGTFTETEPKCGKRGVNETVVIDLHKSEAKRKDSSMVKYLQTRKYVNQHSELSNKQQRNHYERLNRNGERSNNHYAKLVEDGNLPPNMQASV